MASRTERALRNPVDDDEHACEFGPYAVLDIHLTDPR